MIKAGDFASHMKDKDIALNLTPVSRETEARLDVLVKTLNQWQKIKNLVSGSSLGHVWTRHIADSLQLLTLAPEARRWVDLGSGGGFPGLVVAAVLAQHDSYEVHLVESNARKCAFLREAARSMGVSVIVHPVRIEDLIDSFSGKIDVVSARALAALPQLITWTDKLLTNGAVGLFPKGGELSNELTETAKCWRLEYTIHNSLTDLTGRILRVDKAEPL